MSFPSLGVKIDINSYSLHILTLNVLLGYSLASSGSYSNMLSKLRNPDTSMNSCVTLVSLLLDSSLNPMTFNDYLTTNASAAITAATVSN